MHLDGRESQRTTSVGAICNDGPDGESASGPFGLIRSRVRRTTTTRSRALTAGLRLFRPRVRRSVAGDQTGGLLPPASPDTSLLQRVGLPLTQRIPRQAREAFGLRCTLDSSPSASTTRPAEGQEPRRIPSSL